MNSPKIFPSSRRNLPPLWPSTVAGARVNAWTICGGRRQAAHHRDPFKKCIRSLGTEGFYLAVASSAAGWDPQAHLLVEEDPEEIRRRGEELFPQAELAGGEPDARVDGSRCAARGGNL